MSASTDPSDHSLRPDLDMTAIVISDREGVIRVWNPGAEAIFGFSPQAAIGNSLDIMIPPHIRDRHWSGFHRAVDSGVTKYDGLVFADPVTHADGTVQIHRGWIKLLLTTAGAVLGVISMWEPARQDDQELDAPTIVTSP